MTIVLCSFQDCIHCKTDKTERSNGEKISYCGCNVIRIRYLHECDCDSYLSVDKLPNEIREKLDR